MVHPLHHQFDKTIRTVAVIGAGPSGVPAIRHLLDAGFEVRAFERQNVAGGVWSWSPDPPLPSSIPTPPPSVGDFQPHLASTSSSSSKSKDEQWAPSAAFNRRELLVQELDDSTGEKLVEFSPPNPVYWSLHNNVPTPNMEFKDFPFPEGTEWYVPHYDLAGYVQRYAQHFGVNKVTSYNTRVEKVSKLPGGSWRVEVRSVEPVDGGKVRETYWTEDFDAVVVATGHYGAPLIPKFEGIDAWTSRWREKIIHSRAYRKPEAYAGQNVLIVGTGTSGVDIARDLSPHVNKVYQVTRNSFYGPDQYKKQRAMQRLFLPANGEHVSEIDEFVAPSDGDVSIENGKVSLTDGRVLTDIGSIIFSTGYQYSYPFLPDYHRDPGTPVNDKGTNTSDNVLITDGGNVRNLYRDVFYNPDPTLTFLGISINTATFSFFEYQALSITRVFSGQAHLPNETDRREEVRLREKERGSGKFLHLLGKEGDLAYVKETVQWLNEDGKELGGEPIEGRSPEWLAVSDQMLAKLTERHGISLADLKAAIDAAVEPHDEPLDSRLADVKIDTQKLNPPVLISATEVAIEA